MADDGTPDIASRVSSLRIAKNLSQQALADRAGISQTTIDKIERGLSKRSKFLPEIARALGVSLDKIDPRLTPYYSGSLNKQDISSSLNAQMISNSFDGRIPIFSTWNYAQFLDEGMDEIGIFQISHQPTELIERNEIIGNDQKAYGFYVMDKRMSPEFEVGDIVFASPSLPPAPGTSCVFFGNIQGGEVCVIARLLEECDDHWLVRKWNESVPRKADTAVFTKCHRLVVRHIR